MQRYLYLTPSSSTRSFEEHMHNLAHNLQTADLNEIDTISAVIRDDGYLKISFGKGVARQFKAVNSCPYPNWKFGLEAIITLIGLNTGKTFTYVMFPSTTQREPVHNWLDEQAYTIYKGLKELQEDT